MARDGSQTIPGLGAFVCASFLWGLLGDGLALARLAEEVLQVGEVGVA